ncbi:MAG: hypothetical protein IKN16_06255, partial [Selenomonadaceae bacterium]|nr:hypothetical protein [Selenomonadaceae bacterium]
MGYVYLALAIVLEILATTCMKLSNGFENKFFAAARFKTFALEKNFPAEKILEAGYSMERAVALAKEISRPPQVVLLSPACASFDMYSDFEERGRDF